MGWLRLHQERQSAMKKAQFSAEEPHRTRELNLMLFARIALLLSLGAMIVILPAVACSGDPQIWFLAGPLCLLTVIVIWTITLSIGWVVMMVVGIRRIARRLERGVGVKSDHRGPVWDRWMDGPEPLVP
jgi:hypothetical protein